MAVSWNGASEVARWRLLTGPSPASISAVATAPRDGFQTTIAAPVAGRYLALQALDAAGAVLGVSPTIRG